METLGHSLARWPVAGFCPTIHPATGGDQRHRAHVPAGRPQINLWQPIFFNNTTFFLPQHPSR
jgi:hypothetical protein